MAGATRWEFNRLLDVAVAALRRALDLQRQARKISDSGVPTTVQLKIHSRLLVLVRQLQGRLPDYLAAIKEYGEVAEDLARRAASGQQYLLTAEDMCHCLQFIQRAWAGSAAERTRRAEYYGGRAVEYLRRAVEKGYRDAAALQKEKKWEPLRGRGDFRKLVAELQEKEKKPQK
jgi:hypothetical protein